MGNSYVDVIEKNSNIKTGLDKNYSYNKSSDLDKKDKVKLIELAVTSVMDLIIKLNILSVTEMKNRSRSFKYKKATGITGQIIEEIISYEYKQ